MYSISGLTLYRDPPAFFAGIILSTSLIIHHSLHYKRDPIARETSTAIGLTAILLLLAEPRAIAGPPHLYLLAFLAHIVLVYSFTLREAKNVMARLAPPLSASIAWALFASLSAQHAGFKQALLNPAYIAVLASSASYVALGKPLISRFAGTASSLATLILLEWAMVGAIQLYVALAASLLIVAVPYWRLLEGVKPGRHDYFLASLSSSLLGSWIVFSALSGEGPYTGWQLSMALLSIFAAGYMAGLLYKAKGGLTALGLLLIAASLMYVVTRIFGLLGAFHALLLYPLILVPAYVVTLRNSAVAAATIALLALSVPTLNSLVSLDTRADTARFWVEPPGRWSMSTLAGSYVEIGIRGYEYSRGEVWVQVDLAVDHPLIAPTRWEGAVSLGDPWEARPVTLQLTSFPDLVTVTIEPGGLLKASILADYTLHALREFYTPYISGDLIVVVRITDGWLWVPVLFSASYMAALVTFMATATLFKAKTIKTLTRRWRAWSPASAMPLALLGLLTAPLLSCGVAASASQGDSVIGVSIEDTGSGLVVRISVNGTPVAALDIYEKSIEGVTYDYALNYRVEPLGSMLGPVAVLHYTFNGSRGVASGSTILEDGGWATLSILAGEEGPENITIMELGLSVAITRLGTESASVYVDLLRALKENGYPAWFILGYRRVWFETLPVVVDEQWVNIKIKGSVEELGVIRITSHGPFNDSHALRILVDTWDPWFAALADFELAMTCKGCDKPLKTRMRPGVDVIIPGSMPYDLDVSEIIIRELLVAVKAPFIERTVNLTSIVGPVRVSPLKPIVGELDVRSVLVKALGNGWVLANISVNEKLDPKGLKIAYKRIAGDEPVILVGSVEGDETGSLITVYMVFPRGPISGELVIEACKPGIIKRSKIMVGPLDPGMGVVEARRGEVSVSIIPLSKAPSSLLQGLGGDLRGRSDAWLIVLDLGVPVTQRDLLVINVTMLVEASNKLEPVLVVPLFRKTYVEWQPSFQAGLVLPNSSNSGSIEFNEGLLKYTLKVPGALLTQLGLAEALEAVVNVDKVILAIVNALNVTVYNATYTLVKPVWPQDGSGYSGEEPWVWERLPGILIAVLLVVVAVLALYMHKKWGRGDH